MANSYPLGELVRMAVAFTANGAPADPSTITLEVIDPTGASVTYTYGSSAIVRDGVGAYHFDQDVEIAGQWRYRWFGSGTLQAPGPGYFMVTSITA